MPENALNKRNTARNIQELTCQIEIGDPPFFSNRKKFSARLNSVLPIDACKLATRGYAELGVFTVRVLEECC